LGLSSIDSVQEIYTIFSYTVCVYMYMYMCTHLCIRVCVNTVSTLLICEVCLPAKALQPTNEVGSTPYSASQMLS